MFFVSVAIKYKSSAEDELSIKVLTNLEGIFSGAGISTGTTQVQTIPRTGIKFGCGSYQIGKSSLDTNTILFAPTEFNSENLVLWSQPFNIPFKTADFLYITSPEIRYIFVYDETDDEADDIFYHLPPKELTETKQGRTVSIRAMNKEQLFTGGFAVKDNNDQHIRFIFINTPVTSLINGINEEKRSTLHIDTSNKKLTFSDNSQEIHYLTDSDLYGAIFSDNFDFYTCTMQKAFKKSSYVVDVYAKRSQELASVRCLHPTDIDLFKEKIDACSDTDCDIPSLSSYISKIERHNNILIQKEKCATIY